MAADTSIVQQLCLTCGLCCDGALFKDVELRPGDDAARLRALGLPLESRRGKKRFPQPCAALGRNCHCRIYGEHPARCREFECALLKSVAAGIVEVTAALRTIKQTRARADKVRALLRSVSDTDEHLALSVRFRRTTKRLERDAPNEKAAETFGELTLAIHDLNLLLSVAFYPGSTE